MGPVSLPAAPVADVAEAALVAGGADEYELDNRPGLANTIEIDGVPQTHSIHSPQDVDWVMFDLQTPSDLVIRTERSSGDTQLSLYGPNDPDTFIASDDNGGSGTSSRIDRTLEPGRYFVRVEEHGRDSMIDSYTISVEIADSVVSGTVFVDENGNHRRDPEEPGLPGWTVRDGGEIIQTQYDDPDTPLVNEEGLYSFSDSRVREYRLSVDVQEGAMLTIPRRNDFSRTEYATGSSPVGVAVGDFNGDTAPDLAVANYFSSDVSLLINDNDGDGSFSPGGSFVVGDLPRSIAAGDFDGDGHVDLVVALELENRVSVWRNTGKGSFVQHSDSSTGTGPVSVVAGQFNDDNGDNQVNQADDLDLAVANFKSSNVSILLNNGDGSFSRVQNYAVGERPTAVIAADLDKDGNLDLATSNYSSDDVSVLFNLNLDNGEFSEARNYDWGFETGNATSVAAGDLDGNGNVDLAVSLDSGTVPILWGQEDGSFATDGRYVRGGSSATWLAMVDTDSDNDLDLIVAETGVVEGIGQGYIGINRNRGDGTFEDKPGTAVLPSDVALSIVVVADFNDDSTLDVAMTEAWSNVIRVGLNTIAPGNYYQHLAAGETVTGLDFGVQFPGIDVSPVSGLTTTEAGGTAQFDVVLEAKPMATVTIDLVSDDTTEGTVSPASLTFVPDQWNEPQTITVTGVDDGLEDGDVEYRVVVEPAMSNDPNYAGRDADDVSITNTDGGRVVGRRLFYNNSAFDVVSDDAAIALDKVALRPGETASFSNYTSYSRGINGVIVDIANLPNDYTPVPADFEFHVGNDNDPTGWDLFAAPITVDVRRDVPAAGTDRVTIVFDDHDPANPDTTAVAGRWLEVKVTTGTAIGLTTADVFYFGNTVAESGNSETDARTTTADLLFARNNPRNAIIGPANVTFPYDFDRDGHVNATDVLLARNNQASFLNALELIDLSVGGEQAREAPLLELAWLSDLSQPATQRPVQKDGAAEAVDLLLASLWP